jgi:hypothetical protein
MLGMLEVNFACIGASVPVFWPMVVAQFDNIMVTREINVSVTDRHSEHIQLQRSQSLYSNDGSEASRRLFREASTNERASHYKDEYVMEHVDPLRKKSAMAVESIVTVDKSNKR